MAEIVNVAGKTLIKVATVGTTSFTTIGYTRNGADITLESYHLDVPGDELGGDDGPPIDVQHLGQMGRIRLELTKYDLDVLNTTFRAGVVGATAGKPHDGTQVGQLMFTESGEGIAGFRLLLDNAGNQINFPMCFLRNPYDFNIGTKFSTMVMEISAYTDGSGVLYDASSS